MVDNISGFPIKIRKLDDDSNSFSNSRALTNSEISFHNNSNEFPNYNINSNSNKKDNSKNNDSGNFTTTMYQNGQVLSRFLERLKLKTIPHVTPLIERMVEAENKNLNALKSIDKINKRIKELEFHVEKKIKKVDTEHVAVGADITDPNSEEYKRIMTSIPSSPFAPTKVRTSQNFRPSNLTCKDEEIAYFNNFGQPNKLIYPQPNGQIIDLTSEEHKSRSANAGFLQNGALAVPNNGQNLFFNNSQQMTNVSLSPQNPTSIITLSAHFLPQDNISSYLNAPTLAWKRVKEGICLQWDMAIQVVGIDPNSYHIFSFQKSNAVAHNNFPWKQIGEVKALPLPMACTLTQVAKMSTYFFAVRASIQNQTFSPWSNVVLIEVH